MSGEAQITSRMPHSDLRAICDSLNDKRGTGVAIQARPSRRRLATG
jgi:hypothetical protein